MSRAITLYQFKTSPFGEKVRRALHYKGLKYSLHEVPRGRVGEYRWVSPTGKFPAISDGETKVWDSTDIIEYLDRTCPEKPLIPADPREAALVHVLEDWADESLYFYEMTMRAAWEHNLRKKLIHEFVATMPDLTVEKAVPSVVSLVDGITRSQGVGRKPREQIVNDALRHFRAIDALLVNVDWLAGGANPTVADLAVVSQVNALLYAEEAVEIAGGFPRINAWIERVDHCAPADSAHS